MKCIMIAAVSEDGFLTKGDNPNPGDWTSDEDKIHYHNTLHRYETYLMGATTYRYAKKNLAESARKIVMSQTPEEQSKAPNTIFTNGSFRDVLSKYAQQSDVLVLGGASVYHQMLDQKLIDDVYLTIEPLRNKTGVQLMTHNNYFEEQGFQLVDEHALNDRGTRLLHYTNTY